MYAFGCWQLLHFDCLQLASTSTWIVWHRKQTSHKPTNWCACNAKIIAHFFSSNWINCLSKIICWIIAFPFLNRLLFVSTICRFTFFHQQMRKIKFQFYRNIFMLIFIYFFRSFFLFIRIFSSFSTAKKNNKFESLYILDFLLLLLFLYSLFNWNGMHRVRLGVVQPSVFPFLIIYIKYQTKIKKKRLLRRCSS